MIHWTDIEKSKEGILMILEVIKNYEKDGEVRFIAGIQGRHFSEYKIQQLICIVRERFLFLDKRICRKADCFTARGRGGVRKCFDFRFF